ncbi:unnamed protein product [Haemonchus placei]|uniref:Uncharacterized protein n=1 Tax=Haemonchus placei TaxID=6290 RepID=A0A3P7WBE6_HAEPC|nr:unnamed protein product [Haemonchus placei]
MCCSSPDYDTSSGPSRKNALSLSKSGGHAYYFLVKIQLQKIE